MSQPYFDPDAGADHAGALLERVRDALARRAPLRIVGGDRKAFLGRPVAGEPLALAEHRGIVAYDPCELVIAAVPVRRWTSYRPCWRAAGRCLPARRRVSAAGRRSAGCSPAACPDRAGPGRERYAISSSGRG